MSCSARLLRTTSVSWSLAIRSHTMPLRAKVMNPAMGFPRRMASMASDTTIPKPLPSDEPDDVLFHSVYGVRTIELNRPKKLNTLNGSMARKILPRIKEWEKSDMAGVIILKGAGEKSLCAGGDVAALAQWNQQGKDGIQASKDYFALEYKLDHVIATCTKPYVAFMDGITMGGGVGLSIHAPFRVATERTRMAMPETGIGFFPEVGASFFLPRMDGKLGTFLALTGTELTGVNAMYHGVATHYVHSSALPDLENRLAELTFKDYSPLNQRLELINSTLEEFATGLPHDQPMSLSGDVRKAIDKCFAAEEVEEIISRVERVKAAESETSDVGKWASETLAKLKANSPTSLKVTLKQMILGKNWSIAEAFDREYNIASVFMAHHEFNEGVSAKLIRKPKEAPKWQPATLSEVSWKDVDRFFANPEGQERLQLLNNGMGTAYQQYPHAWLGLPTENEVQAYIKQNSNKPREEVLSHFRQLKSDKQGVKEKVSEILSRKTTPNKEGGLQWE